MERREAWLPLLLLALAQRMEKLPLTCRFVKGNTVLLSLLPQWNLILFVGEQHILQCRQGLHVTREKISMSSDLHTLVDAAPLFHVVYLPRTLACKLLEHCSVCAQSRAAQLICWMQVLSRRIPEPVQYLFKDN